MWKTRVNGLVLSFGLGIAFCASGCNGNASGIAANQDGVAGTSASATNPPAGNGSAGAATHVGSGGTGAAGARGGTAGMATRVGSGGTGAAGSSGAGSSSGAAPTFTNVYAIMMQSCAGNGCHLTSPGAAGLLMSNKMTAYMNLVGVGSSKCVGQQRVVAGNPDASVLMLALEHMRTTTCRAPSMPQGKPQLSATDLGTIRAWIMAGAMND